MDPLSTKRVVDVVLAISLLFLVWPLFLLLMLCHWRAPGQAIFAHRRVGQNMRPFDCYKFRTMHLDAEVRLQALMTQCAQSRQQMLTYGKLFNDPRITPLGKLLRKTSLDELPQLINVLKGDMSLVGPRPVTPPELVHYGDQAELVFSVKPGITGLFQVKGRNHINYQDRVMLDLYYVQNQSLWLDLKILFKTPWVVLRCDGAY